MRFGYLVANETARERDGVDAPIGQARVPVRDEGRVEERAVEPDVVPDDDRVARELQERGEHFGDARCRQHHRLGDARQHGDERRDRDAWVDERLEAAEQLPPQSLSAPISVMAS